MGRLGFVTQDELQHLFLTLENESEGFGSISQCSDNLAKKKIFFSKSPNTTYCTEGFELGYSF